VPLPRLSHIEWPFLASLDSRALGGVLEEIQRIQRCPSPQLFEFQFQQLQLVFEHAYRTIPLYREHFESVGLNPEKLLTPEEYRRLPTIKRQDLQIAGQAMHSSQVDPSHGDVFTQLTTGSTGRPVATLGTGVTGLFWKAMTIRDHIWHRRDFSQKLCVIRYTKDGIAAPPYGEHLDNWGVATLNFIRTGPCEVLSITSRVDEQAKWLEYHKPAYLLTYPSLLLELARYFKQEGKTLPGLRQLRSFGEVLDTRTRAACRETFGVNVVDNYSAQEVGYIALQCPDYEHYHVMAEDLLVEILDDNDQPCKPGEIGRVIVTTLHNFAMPLFRYEIGDYAQVGHPCPCGRGLPVLTRILGRQRHLFVLPDGRRRWPALELDAATAGSLPISQFQVIQKTLHDVEVKLVAFRPLNADEERMLRSHVTDWLGYAFNVTFNYVDSIPRNGGKYEDFRCEVTPEEVAQAKA
jgi:phenylacetate-CoA ligase